MVRFAPALLAAIVAVAPQALARQDKPAAGTRYYCPMKCEGEKTYEAPGKCPVCHMALKAAAGTDYTLTLSPAGGQVRGGESATVTAMVADRTGSPVGDL